MSGMQGFITDVTSRMGACPKVEIINHDVEISLEDLGELACRVEQCTRFNGGPAIAVFEIINDTYPGVASGDASHVETRTANTSREMALEIEMLTVETTWRNRSP